MTAPAAPRPTPRPTRSARHERSHPVLRRVVRTTLAFTTVLGLLSAGLLGWAYEKYNGQIKRVAVLQPHDQHIVEAAKQIHAENFLVIGSDSRAGANAKFGHADGARSDTTILIHLAPGGHRATVVSIPRDSWVTVPRCGSTPQHQDMFNAAFSLGGPTCTIATVQLLTGIRVTHFVEVDFSGFERMVDALGTVSICSPQAVDDPKSKLHLHRGVNHLHGAQALAYVRARETLGDGSDLGRIKRQQMFMGAVLRQAMSGTLLSDPARLTDFLDAATRSVTVDSGTTFGDLRSLASAMHGLDPKRVVFYTAPIANSDYSPPGTELTGKVLLDAAKGRALYRSIIDDAGTKPKAPPSTSATTPATSPAPKPNGNAATNACTL